MAALGRLGRGLRRLQRGSGRIGRAMRRVSDRLHSAARRAMNRLGVPPSIQNRIHRAVCSVTGHPVDVATGKVFTEAVDFELPGPILFKWERVWYSASTYEGPLGHGWHHGYDIALIEDLARNVLAIRLSDGRAVAFPILHEDERFFDRQERYELFRDQRGYGLLAMNHLTYRFSKIASNPLHHVLDSIEDRRQNRLCFVYDTSGRLSRIIDSGRRVLSVQHDERGRICGIEGPHPCKSDSTITLVSYHCIIS